MLKLNLKKPILPQLERAYNTGSCLHCGRALSTGAGTGSGPTSMYLCTGCRIKFGTKDMKNYLLVHAICSATIGGKKRRKRLK